MKKITTYAMLLIAATMFILSCGPSQKVTSSWVNPQFQKGQKKYNKIFIAALMNNQTVRSSLEKNMAIAAQAKGYQVVRSQDVFGPSFTKDNLPSKEVMLDKIRASGCDLIYTVTLVDKKSEQRYVPGTTAYQPWPTYGYGFRGYYNYWSPTMYDPGYYTTDKTYFMEGELFDAGNENMIWSVQTEAYNPSSIESFSKSLTDVMMKQVEKDLAVPK
jgi:hypothetical protein